MYNVVVVWYCELLLMQKVGSLFGSFLDNIFVILWVNHHFLWMNDDAHFIMRI